MGCGNNREEIEFVEQMGTGWNLGNSLESVCTDGAYEGLELECYWQNPKTTKEMIQEIYRAGFRTIRIPVTWDAHMDEDGNIEKQWIERVNEVVDYALDAGLYVILDAHHDTWFVPSLENEAYAKEMMEKVWEQIAEHFRDYGTELLFEGMNEPRLIGTEAEWRGESAENDRIVGELNRIFVDTVRNTGGNNENRFLLVTSYAGTVEALEDFELPQGEHLILTVHAYKPYLFAMDETGSGEWNPQEEREIDQFMELLRKRYTSQGIPVIIGEFGAVDKNNTGDREAWLNYYTEKAEECDIMYIWWDEGGPSGETYGRYRLFDRENKVWLFESLKDILVSEAHTGGEA